MDYVASKKLSEVKAILLLQYLLLEDKVSGECIKPVLCHLLNASAVQLAVLSGVKPFLTASALCGHATGQRNGRGALLGRRHAS